MTKPRFITTHTAFAYSAKWVFSNKRGYLVTSGQLVTNASSLYWWCLSTLIWDTLSRRLVIWRLYHHLRSFYLCVNCCFCIFFNKLLLRRFENLIDTFNACELYCILMLIYPSLIYNLIGLNVVNQRFDSVSILLYSFL